MSLVASARLEASAGLWRGVLGCDSEASSLVPNWIGDRDFGVIQADTICANLLEGVCWAAITPAAKRMSSPEPKHLPSTIVREDEGALVSLAKGGDLAAFDELVNRYERRIFRLTMNITQNREDAEDATQDAFLKSFQHLADFQGGSRFYTWLVRIAVNEALMRLRRRRPNVTSLDEPVQTEEDLMPREVEDWGPTPEQRYQVTEMNSILNNAIAELEPIFRTAFVLRDVEQLSTEETAEALGISVPAVKSRLLRARLRLREKLNRFFEQRKPA
jgi:RNA polymerase sigma-70 factor (ECF subfamily)